MPRLTWDRDKKRYRDADSGRLLTDAQVTSIRDDMADAVADQLEALVNDYASGTVQRARFERTFLKIVTDGAIAGYVMGRGGAVAMEDADYDDLATLVAEQEAYARQFFADIERELERGQGAIISGGDHQFLDISVNAIAEGIAQGIRWTRRKLLKLLKPQIVQRARLYAGATVNGFARGQASAHGVRDRLPAHPADGGTPCRSNCRCNWSIVETDTGWEATWQTESDGQVCSGCASRGAMWSPLVIPR